MNLPPQTVSSFVLRSYSVAVIPRPPQRGLNTMNMTRNLKSVALAIAGVILVSSCSATGNANSNPRNIATAPKYAVQATQHGKASWYSVKTNYGTHTASGERLSNVAATAAHKTLPLGTKVRVTNESNGKSEVLTITDRGPYVRGRIIDVTVGAAERLGFVHNGIAPVRVEVLGKITTEAR